MKKFALILLSTLGILQMVSCGEKTPQTQGSKITLIDGVNNMRFNWDGGQNKIRFVANGNWQLETNADWFSADKTQGTAGTCMLTFTAEENAGTDNRTAKARISCGTANLEISAVQGGKSAEGVVLDTIRVMQFNILQATSETAGHEWATVRRGPCVTMFNDIKPDIVCCEEARKSQCNDLASDLPAYSQIKHPKDNIESNGGQRNLILYKTADWTLVGWDKLWFSADRTANDNPPYGDSKTTQKLLMYAHLKHKASQKDLWVFDAHYFASCNNASLRDSCVAITIQTIKKNVPDGVACVFCGDLNINYNDSAMRSKLNPLMDFMDCASIKAKTGNTPETTTYNAFDPAYTKVLDYIFYKNAKGLKYKVVNNKNYGTEFISDHYPLYVDIEF